MDSLPQQSEPRLADGSLTASLEAHTPALLGGECVFGWRNSPYGNTGKSIEGINEFPDSGERYELVTRGGRTYVISNPLPLPEGISYAAITDWLNCTFPFNPKELPLEEFFPLFLNVLEAISPLP